MREVAIQNSDGKLWGELPATPPADDLDIENLSLDLSVASIDADIGDTIAVMIVGSKEFLWRMVSRCVPWYNWGCVPFDTYISCCRSGLTIVKLSPINPQALLPHVCAERTCYQVCFIFRDRYRLFLPIILVYSRSFSSSRYTSTSELRWHATMRYVPQWR